MDQNIMEQLQSLLGGLDLTKIQGMIQPIMDMINQSGGLQGLLSQLQNSGLTDQVSSWLETGTQNLPVSPDQIKEALGGTLGSAATAAGVSVDELSSHVSELLPSLVDKVTPNGQIPGADQISDIAQQIPGGDQLIGMLNSILGR